MFRRIIDWWKTSTSLYSFKSDTKSIVSLATKYGHSQMRYASRMVKGAAKEELVEILGEGNKVLEGIAKVMANTKNRELIRFWAKSMELSPIDLLLSDFVVLAAEDHLFYHPEKNPPLLQRTRLAIQLLREFSGQDFGEGFAAIQNWNEWWKLEKKKTKNP